MISRPHPLHYMQGWVSALLAYPIAERYEERDVRGKLRELRHHYRLKFPERKRIASARLADIVEFAGEHVPYYRDLFRARNFSAAKLRRDPAYLGDLPFLTKEIIREHGDRLLSRPLNEARHHLCNTGGSTGRACPIYYDQPAADYSAAVTLFARESIGKKKHLFEVHFACRFPDAVPPKWPSREDLKCFAMNRSNIFFDRLDDVGLEEIWRTLTRRQPYLVHAHPSTIYALACYVEHKYGDGCAFEVFESSGELLEPYMREAIARALRCRVVDRYGLAELGVMAYELNGHDAGLQVLESEGWPESRPGDPVHEGRHELVFTGFRNRLMPLIRYATGDLARVEQRDNGFVLTEVVGRIHDLIPINGVVHPTHHVQDMLGHRVGGIQEFQIDLRTSPPTLRIVPEPSANADEILAKLRRFWSDGFTVSFCGHDDLVRVGHRAKFRHVITA